MERPQWKSNFGFLLAAAGSAIGLGNIWRFPYLCYKNGGGAFLVPYAIALVLVGIPLLVLELALGHRKKGSAPMAFHLVGRPWEWVGWYPVVLVMFGIMFYYTVIIGWCVNFLWYSFGQVWTDNPQQFFMETFLEKSSGPWAIGELRPPIVFTSLLVWGAIWLICYQELQHGIERACRVFIPLLFILSFILVFYVWIYPGLPGATEGIRWYLSPDWKVLFTKLDPWRDAFGQIFFSLSIGFGIMIAYASYLPRKTNIVKNGVITASLNCGYSFFNGFAVFGVLGFMAAATHLPPEKVVKSGVIMAFVTYPEAINQLPLGQSLFGIVFFVVLILAGLSSAISIMEAFAASVMDKFGWGRQKIVTMLCVLGALGSLLFTHQAGLDWLDIVDHFLNTYGLLVVGFLECLVLGWFYRTGKLRDHIAEGSGLPRYLLVFWAFVIKYVCPVVLGVLLAFSIHDEITKPYEGYAGSALIVLGLFWVLVTLSVGVILSTLPWKVVKKVEP